MAGLESIALAVAHLERERNDTIPIRSVSNSSPFVSPRTTTPPPPPRNGVVGMIHANDHYQPSYYSHHYHQTFPMRNCFNEQTPRTVSTDSTDALWRRGQQQHEQQLDHHQQEQQKQHLVSPLTFVSGTSTPPTAEHALSSLLAHQVSPSSDNESVTTLPTIEGDVPPAPSPDEVISKVVEDDVLCGRGGETNHHAGNVSYRALVKKYQPLYVKSKRRDKPLIAEHIVATIRKRGGRFLKRDNGPNTWRDVGNTKAREKTSQALREGAPDLRNGGNNKNDKDHSSTSPRNTNRDLTPATNHRTRGTTGSPVIALPIQAPSPSQHGDLDSNYNGRVVAADSIISALGQKRKLPYLPPAASISPQPGSPVNFAASVSADDDEDDHQEVKAARGPRLKRLKQRRDSMAYGA